MIHWNCHTQLSRKWVGEVKCGRTGGGEGDHEQLPAEVVQTRSCFLLLLGTFLSGMQTEVPPLSSGPPFHKLHFLLRHQWLVPTVSPVLHFYQRHACAWCIPFQTGGALAGKKSNPVCSLDFLKIPLVVPNNLWVLYSYGSLSSICLSIHHLYIYQLSNFYLHLYYCYQSLSSIHYLSSSSI